MEGLELAKAAATLADDKRAEDIVILDLRGISTITDFFVICTGTSNPHLKAIRTEIAGKLKEDGQKAYGTDGAPESNWLVLDYGDVIVHIFHQKQRQHYALEDLWSDAPRVAVEFAPHGIAGATK